MSKSRLLLSITTAIVLSITFQTSYALKSDKEQPIEVSAQSAERDERLGLTTYTGDVVIKQGTLLMQADQVVLKTIISRKNSSEELNEIITTGQPSHLQQQTSANGDLVEATANTIFYRVVDKKVDLIDNAILKQQGRVITGKKISYDVSAQRVTATSQETGNSGADDSKPAVSPTTPGRVTVIIPAKPKTENVTDSKP